LGCPNLWTFDRASRGVIFHAARGKGAWEISSGPARRIEVNGLGEADLSRQILAESFESGHSSHSHSQRIALRLGVTAPPLRADSQAKYGLVARGETGLYLRLPTKPGYQEKIWDHAAGSIVVEEAGGRVTDVDGQPLDFSRGRTLKNNRGVIATNGLVHARVLEATRAVLAEG
jgi:3'(2'), 5'-bisphosphate nucleotidase